MMSTFLIEKFLSRQEVCLKSIYVFFALLVVTQNAFSASDRAKALQYIEKALTIAWQSDLDFGTAAPGSESKTILPGTDENSENASFVINGEINKAYQISLPADGEVNMVTEGGGSPEKTISVHSFTSFPEAGANGQLDGEGKQVLYVGASRDAILPNQVSGSYADYFTVTVIY
jgi:hypothetical protein